MLRFLLIFLFVVVTSCNSDNPENDSDNLQFNDIDSVVGVDKDSVEVIDDDLSDNLSDEVLTEADVIADKDTVADEDVELPDYDYPAGTEGDPDCPSLLNAGFPYKDGDGKITFCRKCDLPAPANDQQCVRNLWEMNNRRIVEEYPEYYCYPLPCDMTEKAAPAPTWVGEKCDIDALGRIYHNSTGVFKQGDISDGKIGMYAISSKEVDGKYLVVGSLLYDIAAKKYTMVAHSSSKQAFRNNRFVFTGGNWSDKQNYIISASKVENGWKYEAVYANEWNKIEFIYPPAVGENFVLMNVQKAVNVGEDAGPQNILYASVKDWSWKKLGEGQIMDPSIVQDTAFFNYNKSIWACDLTKSPADITTGCRKVSKDGEKATAAAVKKGDKNLVIYSAGEGYYQVVMADLTNETITYKQLDMKITPDLISFAPGQWDGDILALDEMYQFSEVDIDFRTCYYSISKEKKVCFPNPDPLGGTMGYI